MPHSPEIFRALAKDRQLRFETEAALRRTIKARRVADAPAAGRTTLWRNAIGHWLVALGLQLQTSPPATRPWPRSNQTPAS